MNNGKVLEDRPYGKHCMYSEEKLKEMSQRQQEKNDNLLRQLDDKQRADIAEKLQRKIL